MCRKAFMNANPFLILCMVLASIVLGCSGESNNTGIVSSNSGTTIPDVSIPDHDPEPITSSTITTIETTPTITPTPAATTPAPTAGGTSTPAPTFTMLSWDVPTTYTDGAELIPGDISEYRIYIYTDPNLNNVYTGHEGYFYRVAGPAPAASVQLHVFNNAVFTSDIARTTPTTYYLAVTAVANGIESTPSNSVSYTFP